MSKQKNLLQYEDLQKVHQELLSAVTLKEIEISAEQDIAKLRQDLAELHIQVLDVKASPKGLQSLLLAIPDYAIREKGLEKAYRLGSKNDDGLGRELQSLLQLSDEELQELLSASAPVQNAPQKPRSAPKKRQKKDAMAG